MTQKSTERKSLEETSVRVKMTDLDAPVDSRRSWSYFLWSVGSHSMTILPKRS
jgi:hypothetical protein